MEVYSHVKLVSDTSGTNLLLECIFSNLFALQAGFFGSRSSGNIVEELVAKVVTETIRSGGKINLETL